MMKHRWMWAAGLVAFTLLAQDKQVLKSEVNLVDVLASVRDKKGDLVPDVKQSEFHVFEDGVEQEIRHFGQEKDTPLTIGLLFDVSSSVAYGIPDERKAASAFLKQVMLPTNKAFIVGVSGRAVLLKDMTSTLSELQDALSDLESADLPLDNFNGPGVGFPDAGGAGFGGANPGFGAGGPGFGGGNPGFGGAGGGRGAGAPQIQPSGPVDPDGFGKVNFAPQNFAPQRGGGGSMGGGGMGGGGGGMGGGGMGGGGGGMGGPGGGNMGSIGAGGPGGGITLPGGLRIGGNKNKGALTRAQGGGTVIYDALSLSADSMFKDKAGRKVVILITDGQDYGSRKNLAQTLESLVRSDVVVYDIYIKPGTVTRDDGKEVLQRLANKTGGRFFDLGKPGKVDTVFTAIADELRTQYSVSYSPKKGLTGKGFRSIEVKVNRPDIKVQAREGYYPRTEE